MTDFTDMLPYWIDRNGKINIEEMQKFTSNKNEIQIAKCINEGVEINKRIIGKLVEYGSYELLLASILRYSYLPDKTKTTEDLLADLFSLISNAPSAADMVTAEALFESIHNMINKSGEIMKYAKPDSEKYQKALDRIKAICDNQVFSTMKVNTVYDGTLVQLTLKLIGEFAIANAISYHNRHNIGISNQLKVTGIDSFLDDMVHKNSLTMALDELGHADEAKLIDLWKSIERVADRDTFNMLHPLFKDEGVELGLDIVRSYEEGIKLWGENCLAYYLLLKAINADQNTPEEVRIDAARAIIQAFPYLVCTETAGIEFDIAHVRSELSNLAKRNEGLIGGMQDEIGKTVEKVAMDAITIYASKAKNNPSYWDKIAGIRDDVSLSEAVRLAAAIKLERKDFRFLKPNTWLVFKKGSKTPLTN